MYDDFTLWKQGATQTKQSEREKSEDSTKYISSKPQQVMMTFRKTCMVVELKECKKLKEVISKC